MVKHKIDDSNECIQYSFLNFMPAPSLERCWKYYVFWLTTSVWMYREVCEHDIL